MYCYPQQIGVTDLRPDIVIWQDEPKEVTLVELTVCFETGFEVAKERKWQKYIELLEEAECNGYTKAASEPLRLAVEGS